MDVTSIVLVIFFLLGLVSDGFILWPKHLKKEKKPGLFGWLSQIKEEKHDKHLAEYGKLHIRVELNESSGLNKIFNGNRKPSLLVIDAYIPRGSWHIVPPSGILDDPHENNNKEKSPKDNKTDIHYVPVDVLEQEGNLSHKPVGNMDPNKHIPVPHRPKPGSEIWANPNIQGGRPNVVDTIPWSNNYKPKDHEESEGQESNSNQGQGLDQTKIKSKYDQGQEPGSNKNRQEAAPVQGPILYQPKPAQGQGPIQYQPNPVQGPGPIKYQPNPVQGAGAIKYQPNPVQGQGQIQYQPNPVQGPGAIKYQPNPVQGQGQIQYQPNPVQGQGAIQYQPNYLKGSVVSQYQRDPQGALNQYQPQGKVQYEISPRIVEKNLFANEIFPDKAGHKLGDDLFPKKSAAIVAVPRNENPPPKNPNESKLAVEMVKTPIEYYPKQPIYEAKPLPPQPNQQNDNNSLVVTIADEKSFSLDYIGWIVIVVSVLALILLLALVCCVCWKHDKHDLENADLLDEPANSNHEYQRRMKRYTRTNKDVYRLVPESSDMTEYSSDTDEDSRREKDERKSRIREQVSRESKHASSKSFKKSHK